MKTTKQHILCSFIAALASIVLISSCDSAGSDDFGKDRNNETDGQIVFSLSAMGDNNTSRTSDGDYESTPENPDDENEKIKDWFIVFVSDDEEDSEYCTVKKILRRSDPESGIEATQEALDLEVFRCDLTPGIYTAYAFVNVSQTDLAEFTGLSFELEKRMAIKSIEIACWKSAPDGKGELNLWDITKHAIPMSGFLRDIIVEEGKGRNVAIEVVRMVAKADFQFSAVGDEEVVIDGVGLDPITYSSVSLFPTNAEGIGYGHLGKSIYKELENTHYGKVTYNPSVPLTVSGTQDVSCRMYFKESVSKRANGGAFTISVCLRHHDGLLEYEQHALTSDILTCINRNDWLRIPIVVSRYKVDAEAKFYPPIGGYPASRSSIDPDGSQIFTFGTQGEFSITPTVIDKEDGRHLTADRYEVSVSVDDAPANFFTKSPRVTANTGALPQEIIGAIGNVSGTATLTVTVKVPEAAVENGDKIPYIRKVYIVRS